MLRLCASAWLVSGDERVIHIAKGDILTSVKRSELADFRNVVDVVSIFSFEETEVRVATLCRDNVLFKCSTMLSHVLSSLIDDAYHHMQVMG